MNRFNAIHSHRATGRFVRLVCAAALTLVASADVRAAGKAAGTLAFKSWSGVIKHAVLVRGPDEMEPEKNVLRLYLSTDDIGAKIKACKTLSCADQALGDGAMVDFGDSRHLAYAVRLNGSRAQYSGGTNADAFELTTNTPDHLAGTLHIDDSGAGGAKVDAEFDLTLSNSFGSIR